MNNFLMPGARSRAYLAVSIALGTPAFTMSSHAVQLEEVVVTAQKRLQSVQDVPISVSAVSGFKVQQQYIINLDQLSEYIPNVTITDSTAGEQLFIRGLGSGANEGFEQSVGTYVDGLYFGRGRSAKTGFLDLERAEVLKGPQGVLFGKNTIAGAINITTKNPSDVFEAGVKLGYEIENKEKLLEGYVSSPLTDELGVRLAFRSAEHDGWMENTFLGQDNAEMDELSGRFTAVWSPADSVEVITKVQYSKIDFGDRAAQLTDCNADLSAAVAGIDDCRFDEETTMALRAPNGDNQGYENYESLSAGVTVNWDIGEFTLTSITGYTGLEDEQVLELDFSHLDSMSAAPRNEDFDSFSQELRLTSPLGQPVEYIAGLYYEESDLYRINSFNLTTLSRVGESQQDGTSMAVFGSLTWHFSETMSATLGGRYTEDEKKLHKTQFFAAPKTFDPLPIESIPGFGTVHDVNHKRKDTDFSPTLTLSWTPSDDQLFYFTYSEGFKAGGFDFSSGVADLDTIEFEPEQVESFEIGAKTTFPDYALQVNVAAFHSDFSDLQVSTFDGNLALLVGNAAEAVVDGLELDVRWAISDTLTFSGAVAYLDAEYDSYETAQCSYAQSLLTPAGAICLQDMSGKDLSFAPAYSGSLSLTYDRPIGDKLSLRASTDVNFTDDYWVAGDADPRSHESGFTKINARIALGATDGRWEVGVLAKNLTDEKTSHWSNDVPGSPGSYYAYLDRPRTVMFFTEFAF